MASILLAEDDSSLRTFLGKALGKAGHMVPACDSAALAAAIHAVAALPLTDRAALKIAARARMVDLFSVGLCADQYEQLYVSLC